MTSRLSSLALFKRALPAVIALGLTAATAAQAQLYVADTAGFGKVGVYDDPSGATINSWVVDTPNPLGMAVSSNYLYVGSYNNGTVGRLNLTTHAWNSSFITTPYTGGVALAGSTLLVGDAYDVGGYIKQYDANTGALVNATFISDVSTRGFVVSDGKLYDNVGGTIEVFDASSGASISASLATGVDANAIAVSGSRLFALDGNHGTISIYDTVSGTELSPSFITQDPGMGYAYNLIVSGNTIYVAHDSTIAAYDAISGAVISDALISGRQNPNAMAVGPIPEPSTYAMLTGVGAFGLAIWRRRKAA